MTLAWPDGVVPTVEAEVMAIGKVYRLPARAHYWQMPLTSKQVSAINVGATVVLAPVSDTNYWILLWPKGR